MITFRNNVEYVARHHFDQEDVEMYLKMLDWMEKAIDAYDSTANLEIVSSGFLEFLNSVGHEAYYDHVGRINMPSREYRDMTKKEAFERELGDLKISMQASREKLVKEGQDRLAAMEAQRNYISQHVASLGRDYVKLQVMRGDVAAIAAKIVDDYRITNVEVKRLLEEGETVQARSKLLASDIRIKQLEEELVAVKAKLGSDAERFNRRITEPSYATSFAHARPRP